MKIVFLNQFFWPDEVATSLLLTDLAMAISEVQDVAVLCGSAGTRSMSSHPRVEVIRTRTISFKHNASARIASYISYLFGAVWHGICIRKPDIFVTLTTPPILSFVGSILSAIHGSQHIIWEMDVYPDIATDLKYFKKGALADRILGTLLDWSRKRASAVIVLGEDMRSRLVARGIPESKIHIAENWADGQDIAPKALPRGPLVIQYSGNLGLAHEIATITDVMIRLRNCPEFLFAFVGGGPRRKTLEDFCSEHAIRNVSFRPYCRRDELSESLSESHVGLVTQLPETLGSIVPSKIYGIMAAGRPLLYIGPEESTAARHIARFNCGWHISPGDVDALEKLLWSLSENSQMISEFGSNARRAFELHFDRSSGTARVMSIIQNQLPAKHPATVAQVMRSDQS